MENATNNRTGPIKGNPYSIIVLKGSFDVERFAYPTPTDALVGAIRYLRLNKAVRLSDRTCAALREAPELATLDAILSIAGEHPDALGAGLAGLTFKAPDHA